MDITSYLLGKKAGGGGGGENKWRELGYPNDPSTFNDAYTYAKNIYDNWDETQTSMLNKYQSDNNLAIFPLVNLENVTTMENAFNGSFLIQIPDNLNTSNVENMYFAFSNCCSLKKVTINTSKSTDCTNMFNGCIVLEEVGNLDLRKAPKITNMFKGCNNLKTIGTIQGLSTTSSNANASSMFYNCTKLVNAPSFDTSKYKRLGSMYYNCLALENVPIYNFSSIENANNSVSSMFYNCRKLTNESLNNILASLKTATGITTASYKTLKAVGLSSTQATTCTSLSNWADLESAGWTTGY